MAFLERWNKKQEPGEKENLKQLMRDGLAVPTIEAGTNDADLFPFLAKAVGELKPDDKVAFRATLETLNSQLKADRPPGSVDLLLIGANAALITTGVLAWVLGHPAAGHLFGASVGTWLTQSYRDQSKEDRLKHQKERVRRILDLLPPGSTS